MMNKTFLYFFVFLLGISFVFAAAEDVVTGTNPEIGPPNLEVGPPIGSGNLEAGFDNPNGSQHDVAIMTANKGEASQLKVQTNSEFGSTIRSGDGQAEAKTEMKMSQGEDGKTYAQLSNGMNAEVKVMPDTASERALEVLGAKCEEMGCEVELKEVGKGEQTKAAYEVQAKKEVKFLGMFKSQMKVNAQIDAETGEVVRTRNAWWGFLAKKNLEE